MARDFEFPRPTAADFGPICRLLSGHGLPTDDLTLPMLAHFRVSRDDGQVVAVGGIEALGNIGLLRSVAVAPTHRGRGLAGRLVGELEREAVRLRLSALYLLTTTAEAFFARLGYVVVERTNVPAAIRTTAEFSRLCPDSALCMWKDPSA